MMRKILMDTERGYSNEDLQAVAGVAARVEGDVGAMNKVLRFADARNCTEGKIVATALSVLLALSFMNLSVLADRAVAEEFDGAVSDVIEQPVADVVDEAEDSEVAAGEGALSVAAPAAVIEATAEDGTRVTVTGTDLPEGTVLTVEFAATDKVADAVAAVLGDDAALALKGAYTLSFADEAGEPVALASVEDYTVTMEVAGVAAMGAAVYRIAGTGQAQPVVSGNGLIPDAEAALNAFTFTTKYPASTFAVVAPTTPDAGEGVEGSDGSDGTDGSDLDNGADGTEGTDNGEGTDGGTTDGTDPDPDNGGNTEGETPEPPVAPEPDEPTGSNVDDSAEAERLVLYVGETRNLSRFVAVSQNWMSENPTVATVSLDGTVNAVAPGITIVTCDDNEAFEIVVRPVVANEMANGTVELAHFYFLPPTEGEDGAAGEASLANAKFLGSGLVKIPAGTEAGQVLLNGTVLPESLDDAGNKIRNKVITLADLIVSAPSDREVRMGLAAYYNGSIDADASRITADSITGYSFEPVRITGKMASTGYKGEALSPESAHHIYVQMNIATEDSYTVSYKVTTPTDVKANSVLHRVGEDAIELSVPTDAAVTVDGTVYEPAQRVAAEGSDDGVTYRFDGWYTDAAFQHRAPAAYTGTESITFYARYVSDNARRAIFDCVGGSFANDDTDRIVMVDEGAAYWLPEAPMRFGYEFAGWQLSDTESVYAPGFGRTMEGEDVRFVALWEAQDASITLDCQGGTLGAGESLVLEGKTGAAVEAVAGVPVKPGYIFTGWNTEADGSGALLTELPSTFPAGTMVLYAQYVEDPTQFYSVTYRATYGGRVFQTNGLAPAGSQVSDGKILQGGTEGIKGATAESLFAEYYVFQGWYKISATDGGEVTTARVTDPSTSATANVLTPEDVVKYLAKDGDVYENAIFEARFDYVGTSGVSRSPYFVAYYLMNDEGAYPAEPDYLLQGTGYFLEGERSGLDEERAGLGAKGLAFLGGYLANFDASLYQTDVAASELEITYLPATSATFSVYAAKRLLVTFDAGDHGAFADPTENGAVADNEQTVAFRIMKGDGIPAVPAATAHEGYVFAGWTADGAAVANQLFDAPVSRAVTYTAAYEALPAAISFVTNGGTDVPVMEGVTGGDTGRALPTTTREGYTFLGWFDNADLEGEALAELPAGFPVGDTTYYAKWQANPADIRFDKNAADATGSQAGVQGVTDGAVPNVAFPETCGYERAGYVFAGWNTQADGKGATVTDFPATFAPGTTIYYAQWKLDTSWLAAADFSWAGTYDGRAHGVVAPAGLALKNGETMEVVVDGVAYSASAGRSLATDVADSIADATVRLYDRDGNVIFETDGVSVAVTPAPLTVLTGSVVAPYDGTPVTCEDIAIIGLVNGETLGYRATGSATDVNVNRPAALDEPAVNGYELTWAAAGNGYTAKEGNYTVTAELGTISVTTVDCPVSIEGYVGVYDGQQHSITYAVADGEEATVTFDGPLTYTDAGLRAVGYTVECPDHGTFEGFITMNIVQRPVTIAVEDSFKLASTEDPVFNGAIVDGSLVRQNDLGAITFVRATDTEEVGMYPGALVANYMPNDNYAVVVLPGTFTIGPIGSVLVRPSNPLLPPRTFTGSPAPTDDVSGEIIEGIMQRIVLTVMGEARAARAGAEEVAALIFDDEVPAASGEVAFDEGVPTVKRVGAESIDDDATALGAFDAPHCWVHWLMALGIVITVGFAAIAIAHRAGQRRRIESFEAAVEAQARYEADQAARSVAYYA